MARHKKRRWRYFVSTNPDDVPMAAAEESPRSLTVHVVRTVYEAIKAAVKESHASRNSVLALVTVNLYTIGLAVYAQWPTMNVILLYWLQNIIIGVFSCVKLVFWKNISFADDGEDRDDNGERLAPLPSGWNKPVQIVRFTFAFFLIHLLLLKFLFSAVTFPGGDLATTFTAIRFTFALLILNHTISFFLNYAKDTATPTTYRQVDQQAFIRVLPLFGFPLYFAIIFVPLLVFSLIVDDWSVMTSVALVLFMVLKSIVDIIAHLATHSPAALSILRAKDSTA